MKKRTSFAFLARSALSLVSCSRAVTLEIYDNTGSSIEVRCADTELQEQVYFIENKSAQRACVPYRLTIKHAAGTWFYADGGGPIPRSFKKAERFGHIFVQLQVEHDGTT